MNYYSISTDDTLLESVSHGSNAYPFAYYLEDIWAFDFHCIDWHWHPELEFMSVESGSAVCRIGTEKVELLPGYGLFVNSSILHRFEADRSTVVPNIVFSPDLIAPEHSLIYDKYIHPVIHSELSYLILDPSITWQKQILQILADIYRLQEDKDSELDTLQKILSLWNILFHNMAPFLKIKSGFQPDHPQGRLQIMMQYIHDHYNQPLTLQEIAASASVGKSSALQIFQSNIHISPVAYLIQYRLGMAANLLYKTTKPVNAVAAETGFSNTGYFCRKFKEMYHMSPNKYRAERTTRTSPLRTP